MMSLLRRRRPVVLSAGGSGVHVWALANGRPVRRAYQRHRSDVTAMAITAPSGGRALTVSSDDGGAVHVWDLTRRRPLGPPYTGHAGLVWSVAVAEVGGRTLVASAGIDAAVRIWDPITHELTAGSSGTAGVFSTNDPAEPDFWQPRWDLLTARLLDPRTGEPMDTRSWDAHAGPIYSLAAGVLDGRAVVASAGADATVRLWDFATGRPLGQPYTGHRGGVLAVKLTDLDGRNVVVSAGEDSSVHVWDLATQHPIGAPYRRHSETVRCLAIGVD